MKCSHCSAEIPSQSQFCLRCGKPLTMTAATTPAWVTSTGTVAVRRNNRPLVIGASLLALLVMLGVGALVMRNSLVQKPTQTDAFGNVVQSPSEGQSGNLVQAPSEGQNGNLVQTPVQADPNKVVQAPTEAAPSPTDVIDYLKFLKQIEVTKQNLTREEFANVSTMIATFSADQLKDMINSLDPDQPPQIKNAPSTSTVDRANDEIINKWDQLAGLFNQRRPPSSCVDLYEKYLNQLGMIQAEVLKVHSAITNPDKKAALKELMNMKGNSSDRIDESVKAADKSLATVCSQFRLEKDFDIKSDPSGVGLTGLLQ